MVYAQPKSMRHDVERERLTARQTTEDAYALTEDADMS